MDIKRRDLFGILAALGGLPLVAKEIEAPQRLILDPGDVVRFDSLAAHERVRVGGWGGGSDTVARIPVTRRAVDHLRSLNRGFGRFAGFEIVITPSTVPGQPDRILLDYGSVR